MSDWIDISLIPGEKKSDICRKYLDDKETVFLKVKTDENDSVDISYAIGWFDIDAVDGFWYCDLTFIPQKRAYERKFSYLFDNSKILAFMKIGAEMMTLKKDEKDLSELSPCSCGGEVTLSKIDKNGGMDGRYEDWEIFCHKCGGSWNWPADCFYGRDFYTKEQVIELWNSRSQSNS